MSDRDLNAETFAERIAAGAQHVTFRIYLDDGHIDIVGFAIFANNLLLPGEVRIEAMNGSTIAEFKSSAVRGWVALPDIPGTEATRRKKGQKASAPKSTP